MLRWLLHVADLARHTSRRRCWSHDQALGRRGEDLAHRFLRRRGYVIVARNFRTRSGSGEIDLVARDGDTLVCVEVKSRATAEFGEPLRAIGDAKQESLVRAAREYARRADIPWERVRFDTVSVVFSDPPSLAHAVDVFRAPSPMY